MAFMLILSHSIVLLCKFTPPHQISKLFVKKLMVEGEIFAYCISMRDNGVILVMGGCVVSSRGDAPH